MFNYLTKFDRKSFLLLFFLIFTLTQAEAKRKENPVWNRKKCAGKLLKDLTVASIDFSEKEHIYIIGKLTGSDGSSISIQGGNHISFKPTTYQAKDKSLKLPIDSNIVVYGTVDISTGQVIFNVRYIEPAPSNREIFRTQVEQLANNGNSTDVQWMGLARWALDKGVEGKDQLLIKGSQICFRRGLKLKEDALDPEKAQQTTRFIKLIQIYRELNQTYKKLGRQDLLFPKKKILSLLQVVIRYKPNIPMIQRILAELGFIKYKGSYRMRKEFKKLEGFLLYKGEIKKYNLKWVSPLFFNLLKSAEKRVVQFEQLRQKPSVYEEALKRGSFAMGMDKREVVLTTGYPKEIIRVSLKKVDKSANVDLDTTYEIWKYGTRKDQYICFEQGNVFYYPDTFTPLKQD